MKRKFILLCKIPKKEKVLNNLKTFLWSTVICALDGPSSLLNKEGDWGESIIRYVGSKCCWAIKSTGNMGTFRLFMNRLHQPYDHKNNWNNFAKTITNFYLQEQCFVSTAAWRRLSSQPWGEATMEIHLTSASSGTYFENKNYLDSETSGFYFVTERFSFYSSNSHFQPF